MRDLRWLPLAAALLTGCGPGVLSGSGSAAAKPEVASARRPETSTAASAAPSAGSVVTAYFSKVDGRASANKENPDSIARHCADAVKSARRTLDVAGFEIDNKEIVEAIVAAKLRGVAVRVITETEYEHELGPLSFASAGIPVVSDHRSGLMHTKFLVLDGQAVWTGSFNFTENCAYRNNNNGVLVRDAQIAENYATWFEWFWTEGKNGRKKPSKRTPHPDVTLADGTRAETRFTTFDRPANLVLAFVRDAKKSLRIMMFAFTSKPIVDAVIARAAEGVKVTVVLETRETTNSSSIYERLRNAPGVEVQLDGNPFNMHHKVMIVDDASVLTGSYNYTRGAETDNDENLIAFTGNRALVAAFAGEFDRVLAKAKAKSEAAAAEPAHRRR